MIKSMATDEELAELGYTGHWFDARILTHDQFRAQLAEHRATRARQVAEATSDVDPHAEHYRRRPLQDFLGKDRPLTDADIKSLLLIERTDRQLGFGTICNAIIEARLVSLSDA